MTREAPLDEPPPQLVRDVVNRACGPEITAVSRVEEGLNAVYRIEHGGGESLILKLATVNEEAELRVEAHILSRIAEETDIPVPSLIETLETSSSGLPVFAYLMTSVGGRRVRDVTVLSRAGREQFVDELGRHLAAIHNFMTFSRFGEPELRAGTVSVPTGHQEINSWLTEQAVNVAGKLRGDGYVTDDEPRFSDFSGEVKDALSQGNLASQTIESVLTHGDPRPANMVFAESNEKTPLIRGLLDIGGPITDGLSDLANAEVALIGVPLGGTEEAANLRSRLRAAYESERSVGPVADQYRYTLYRLLHRARTLAGFSWWRQFAREPSDEATARRFRSDLQSLLQKRRERAHTGRGF